MSFNKSPAKLKEMQKLTTEIIIILIFFGNLNPSKCELMELRCDEIKTLSYHEKYNGGKCTINGVNGESTSTFVIRSANKFEYSKQISDVEFSNSKLYDMPREVFATFQYLKKAQANNCGIEEISKYNFNYASELQELRMRSNKIKKLPNGVFSQLNTLMILDLSSNEIEEVQKDAFAGMIKLQYMALSDNKISTLDENLFRDLSNLMSIRLDSNKLQVIDEKLFASTNNLTDIRLDSNDITIISDDVFQQLKDLRLLNLGNNKLTNLKISETNIEKLFIPYNKLTNLDLNKNLKLLYGPYNEIKTINLNGNTELEEIKMRQNSISDISNLGTLAKLQVLDLSYNPLKTLNVSSFARMPELAKLNLEYTKIKSESLMFGTFAHNSNLTNLDLSYNQLRRIDFNIFTALTHLTHLKIDGNNLTEIAYENIKTHFPKLSLISLNDNDWNCTYLSAMIKSLKQNNIIVFVYSKLKIYDEANIDGIRCVINNSKHVSWNVPVTHLDDDDYLETSSRKSQKSTQVVDLKVINDNITEIWNKISEIESSNWRMNDAIQESKNMATVQKEALVSNSNQDRDIILQSEFSFIKITLCFMCFILSLFVCITVIKFLKKYTINHSFFYPSDNFRHSTATIQTTMEHVM